MGRLVVLAPTKLLTVFAAAGLLFVGTSRNVSAQAQQEAASKWADRAEYDLYQSIAKETDPAKRIHLLDEWKTKYPNSKLKADRDVLYVTTYGAAQKPQETLNAAKEALSEDPENVTALYWATLDTPYAPPTPENFDFGEKAANGLLAAKKPAAMSDADWEKTKGQLHFEATAQQTLGWVALQKKDYETAETHFAASLKANPNNGQVSYWKGQAILAEKKPEKQGEALYDIARAAAYTGPGAMQTGRDQVKAYLTKVYAQFHGSDEGFDALMARAATSAFPGDYVVKSVVDLEKEKAAKAAEMARENPMLALWNNMKALLTSDTGAQYFESNVKGAALPGNAVEGVTKFKGKLISADPETRPKTLVLGIQNATTPEVTLELDAALPGKADVGTEISFSGIAKAFTATPFNLTLTVEKKDVEGWPVKAEPPARRPARRRGRK